ncbi:hypothetical protein Q5P01_002458 [Channa striata]|uniref:Ferric-chelate reductase 1 n=1 Tax=Channa striata TaxID=64152 RepID=A0AA88TDZ6_CHASR|nr:hypothetical protein Q5P01_002458 [Channa striata]
MDTRLIITVVFMVAVTINTATADNSTTPTNATTNGSDNSTTTTATPVGNSTVNGTTAAPNTTAAAQNNSTTAAVTTANNSTANGTTTAGSNNSTTAGNGTTVAPTTSAPPLTPNTTVDVLNTTISSSECGKTLLCAAQPSSCDPSTNGSCFFLGAQQQSGLNFLFSLSGISTGYIASTISPGTSVGPNATTYVCANNNGVVKFISSVLNNGILTPAVLNVNSVRGKVNGNKIQCTFAATVPSPTTKAIGVTFTISNGTYNSNSDSLGSPNDLLRSTVTDLGNPNSTVINSLSANSTNTTSSPTTTNYGIKLQQSLTQALLITVGVLGLALL